MTFREFQLSNNRWSLDRKADIQAMYESMRTQTYYLFAVQLPKKNRKTWDQFKQMMPFPWDKKEKPVEAFGEEAWAEIDKILAMKHQNKKKSDKISLEALDTMNI